MQIFKVNYSRLLKLELPELAERVVSIFEEYDPEEFKIKEAYDQLVAQEPQIAALLARYGAHPLTTTLNRLRKKRLMYASEIVSQLKFHLRDNNEDQTLINAKVSVDQFLLHLSKNNEEVTNRKITQFFAEVELNEGLTSTLRTLNLMDNYEKLELTHSDIRNLLEKRVLSKAARPKGKTNEFSQSVINALRILFMQIEVAHSVHKDLDYTLMINALNEILIRYRDLINSRASYNKKKKEGSTNEPEMDPEAPEIPEVLTTFIAPTNGIELPTMDEMNENGVKGELALPLAQKKTVAPSSKPVQLPSINNEA